MIFNGGILGGTQKFHLDSYLNGTTVPFDIYSINEMLVYHMCKNGVHVCSYDLQYLVFFPIYLV